MNPEDAKRLDRKDGEMVTVKSRRGEIDIRSGYTDGI